MTGGPGTAAGEWLDRALAVLALRLRHEVALTRVLRGAERQESFLGLFVSDDEAEAILAEASGRLRASGTAASAAEIARLQAQLADDRRADRHGIWNRLAEGFGLGEAELDLVLLAAAPSLDPRFGRVYGYLNDDLARRHLTPGLAVRLLERHGTDLAALRRMLAPGAPLRAGALVELGPERPMIEAALRTEDEILDRLLGDDRVPDALASRCDVVPVPHEGRPRAPARRGLPGTATRQDAGGTAVELAGRLGLDVLLVEAERMEAPDRGRARLTASCVREARLSGALPVLEGFDTWPAADRHELVRGLRAPAVVLTGRPEAWADAGPAGSPGAEPTADRAERIAALVSGHPADAPGLRAWLERLGRLDLLTLARLLARHRDETGLRAAVRSRMSRGFTGLAELVDSRHGLDDLVVPPRTRAELQTLVAWQDTRTTVRERWGLGRVFGRGAGTTALFKGPSGTGKTMAAAAVANCLDVPLVRVNLAGLVSKYIGDTEKNLDHLFAAAEAADVVLFFDEADAVFGRRSEVHDAHDRYANLETAYLLQRLETYDGIGILASNLHQNIDEAFLRRIDLVIDFPAPAPEARRAIWQRLHAGTAPVDPAVDLDLVAARFELTGGQIRNCCLAAAHTAASNGGVIGMDALMQAVGKELVKSGKPIRRAAFGAHWSALRAEEDHS